MSPVVCVSLCFFEIHHSSFIILHSKIGVVTNYEICMFTLKSSHGGPMARMPVSACPETVRDARVRHTRVCSLTYLFVRVEVCHVLRGNESLTLPERGLSQPAAAPFCHGRT